MNNISRILTFRDDQIFTNRNIKVVEFDWNKKLGLNIVDVLAQSDICFFIMSDGSIFWKKIWTNITKKIIFSSSVKSVKQIACFHGFQCLLLSDDNKLYGDYLSSDDNKLYGDYLSGNGLYPLPDNMKEKIIDQIICEYNAIGIIFQDGTAAILGQSGKKRMISYIGNVYNSSSKQPGKVKLFKFTKKYAFAIINFDDNNSIAGQIYIIVEKNGQYNCILLTCMEYVTDIINIYSYDFNKYICITENGDIYIFDMNDEDDSYTSVELYDYCASKKCLSLHYNAYCANIVLGRSLMHHHSRCIVGIFEDNGYLSINKLRFDGSRKSNFTRDKHHLPTYIPANVVEILNEKIISCFDSYFGDGSDIKVYGDYNVHAIVFNGLVESFNDGKDDEKIEFMNHFLQIQ